MKNNRVKTLLLCTVLVMTGVPLIAAFYFLDDALERSLNLGFNPQVVQALDTAADNLKRLKTADPANEARYRVEFERVEALQHIYAQPDVLKRTLRDSLKVYFGIGLVAAVMMSVVVALLLSRRISRSYEATFDELMRQRDRVRYLEQMASWQELARILAHEIKNPLTPIEVLITSLSRAHRELEAAQFESRLAQAQAMIREEISQLKATVAHFSDFAKLPAVQLTEHEPVALVREHLPALSATHESAQIRLDADGCAPGARVRADQALIRHLLANIVANGVEANAGRKVQFSIRVNCTPTTVNIAISNDGAPVPSDLAKQIFEPYISSKGGRDHMGLGLAIVKKIAVEHAGEISYNELPQVSGTAHPCFTLALPRSDA
jgi:signal transduction histidine kinase